MRAESSLQSHDRTDLFEEFSVFPKIHFQSVVHRFETERERCVHRLGAFPSREINVNLFDEFVQALVDYVRIDMKRGLVSHSPKRFIILPPLLQLAQLYPWL